MSGRSLRQLFTDRLRKQGWYDSADYWDMKAANYSGLARSNWPSNRYNALLHQRQMNLIDQLFGDVRDRRIADVGCGTGRVSHHLASRGALVTGIDFSPKALAAAESEGRELGLQGLTFREASVKAPLPQDLQGQFDCVVSVGCLTLACGSVEEFRTAVENVRSLMAPGARLLFVEPIHRSRLLRRILPISVPEWVTECTKQGLRLEGSGSLLFVPMRYALAFRDLPDPLPAWGFHAGERVLEGLGWDRLGDYKWLLFGSDDR